MKINKYIYLFIAFIFIILISLVSYYLGMNTSGKKSSSNLVEESTMTPVPTNIIESSGSSLSATPKEASPSVTSGLKISIMPKITPSVTPAPTSKLIFNPNLKKVVLLPTATPTVIILKISPVKQIGI